VTARRAAYLLTAVLVGYLAVVGWRGWQLVSDGRPPFVLLGVGVLLLPVLGAWFVWQELSFGRATGRLAGQLAAEEADERPADERPVDERSVDERPVDGRPRTRGGRVDRAAADAVFARRRAEVELEPGDWRVWFRLAVAYGDAGDTRRGRHAMRHAISLYEAARRN
jgi:hypothetical protein